MPRIVTSIFRRITIDLNSSTRQFTINPALLFDVIKAQAGTLGKAISEGIANSLDAGATKCVVTLTPTSFSIVDDGRGFGEGEEGFEQLKNFFECFGAPHVAGDAVLGRYRIGRGQMFSAGVSKWRTGTFQMSVDIQHKGLDYELEKNLPSVPGCHIETTLYEPLSAYQFTQAIREVEQLVEFVGMPVILNGKRISKDPDKQKWDLVTPEAYFNFRESGAMTLFNLGFLVRSYPHHQFGTAGVCVSRVRLDVNFARNDVLVSKCAVFKKIAKELEQHAGREVKKKKSLTNEDREFLAMQVLSGQPAQVYEAQKLKLVTDVMGRHYPLSKLSYGAPYGITVAPSLHDRLGEMAHSQGLAFVLAPVTLERFNVGSLEELYAKLNKAYRHGFSEQTIVDFDKVTATLSTSHRILQHKELSAEERISLRALNDVAHWLWSQFRDAHENNGIEFGDSEGSCVRLFEAGEAHTLEAWTDAAKWVAIERRLLKQMHGGLDDIFYVLMVIAHEAAHDSADTESHDHDAEFFSRFHDLVTSASVRWGHFATRIADRIAKLNAEEGRKVKLTLTKATAYAQPETSPAE
ncbi:MAG: hypothetical protein ING75_15080 [Rhodocyclaceae bacterium]|nr:hypothetical protein [Rhodocyclaceae bacterium]